MENKFKSFLMFLLLAWTSIQYANAYDFSAVNDDGVTIYYNILSQEDKTCETTYKSTSYNSYSGTINVPSTVTFSEITYSVNQIGESSFYKCPNLTNVNIPNTITVINKYGFLGCTSLETITIPESITFIGSQAYSGCTNLKTVNYNAVNCTTMGDFYTVFKDCTNLENVNFGDKVKIIPRDAFRKCTGIKSIIIPNSVTTIEAVAFQGCTSLSYVSIPDTPINIDGTAFKWCTSLPVINHVRYADTFLVDVDDKTQSSYTIKEGTRFIGESAFSQCKNLKSIYIPESVTYLGNCPFYECSNLNSFSGKFASNDGKYLIVEGLFNSFAPYNIDSYVIPNEVTAIGERAFQGCEALKSVTIPYTVNTIFSYAFANCTRLESIICKNPDANAISLGSIVFYGIPTSSCKIYVPEGASYTYKVADQWKDFYNIVEGDYPEDIKKEIDTFKNKHGLVIRLTIENVESRDIDGINKALEDYEALSDNAKDALTDEKRHLDELLATAEAKKKAEEDEAAAKAAANEFKTNNQSVLNETVATVELSDKDAVNKAIEDYSKLSDRAKEIVKSDYDHLEELQKELNRLETEITVFKENNANVLSKTVDGVKSSDLYSINEVLSEFDKLSTKAKEALSNEKKHLDELLAAAEAKKKAEEEEAAAQASANQFKADYDSVLSETVETVELSDKDAVNKAIGDYSNLSDRAKEIVKTEYDHLVELQKELNRLENEIMGFKEYNADVLVKTTDDVKSSDLDLINEALSEFDKLSTKAKEALTNDKKHLEDLLATAEAKKKAEEEEAAAQAAANAFKTNNRSVLSETVATVELSDKDAVNKAIEDYSKLSDRAKEIAKSEYDHLIELQKELNRLENEISDFKENNANVLSKTVDCVKSSDLDLINEALSKFDKLSTKAKEALANEKKHLDELLAAAEAQKKAEEEEAAAQAAANEFRTNNQSVLSETVATVELSDKEAVNKAMEDYSNLSNRTKEILKTDYDNLVALQNELNRLENEISEFKKYNSKVLSKTVDNVKSSDIDLIKDVLSEFNLLSTKAKEALANEKKHLEELLVAAEAKKKAEEEEAQVQAEVTKFKLDNAYVLSRTTESVQSNDLDAINKALADYEKLSDKAKEALKDTKSNLDALKRVAEEKKQAEEQEESVQAEIAKFKLDNAYILSRSIDVIQSNDLAAIDKAMSDFDKLSDAAKAALAYQKEILDALKEKAEEIKKAEEEAAAVEKEVTEFCYNNGEVLTKTTDSVTADDLDAINRALAEYEKLSDTAKEMLADAKKLLEDLKNEAEAQKQTAEDVKEFNDNNKGILDKEVTDVTPDDFEAINKALEDYENLSDRAKEELADEKKHLDELKEEAEAQKQTAEDVKEYMDNNSEILDKSVADVTPNDLDAINKALEDYENLSDRAKEELADVKEHLDELKKEAEAQKQTAEDVKIFKDNNKEILDKTVADVTPDDLDAINKALEDYNNLSDRAKEELAYVKKHLDELKKEAEAQKQTAEDVKKFKDNNKEILEKTVDDVTPDDLDAINKALGDYENLSDRTKEELAEVKKHLDELKEEAEAQKQAAEDVKEFKDNNKEILDKTVEDVTPDDLDTINKALEDYENLSDRAKDELADVKEHLDELKDEAEAQKQTTEDVKEFTDNNKEIIDKSVGNVTPDDLDAINKALEDYKNLSDRAKEELADVKEHLDELKNEAEAQKQTAEDVKEFKDNNKEILDKTVEDVTPDDLDAINKALEDYENLSDRAKEELANVKENLDELKDEAEAQKQTAEDVKEFKDNNKEILDKTVEDVTADDLDNINKALEDYENLSDRAKEELSDVKDHLDELKEEAETKKQIAEEVEGFREKHKEILSKTVDNVTADDLDAINQALSDYENLSDRVKEELAKEKELLDALKEKAESLGISSICVDEDKNVKTYDLQGHIISNNAKGLIIQNGKKVYRR